MKSLTREEHLGMRVPADVTKSTDAELLNAYIANDQQACFRELVDRYSKLVMGACYRVLHNVSDAQDAAQATFVVLAKKPPEMGTLRTLGPWIHRVANRKSLDHLRARQRRVNRDQREYEKRRVHDVPSDSRPTANLEHQELLDSIDKTIAELPAKFRDVLVLRYLQGKKLEEIAEELGSKLSTVTMRLTRGRELLRSRLSRRGVTAAAIAGLSHASLEASVPPIPPDLSTQALEKVAIVNSDPSLLQGLFPQSNTRLWVGLSTAFVIATVTIGVIYRISIPSLTLDHGEESPEEVSTVDYDLTVEVSEKDAFELVNNTAPYWDLIHAELLSFLRSYPEDIDSLRNERGETLLNVAARRRNIAGVYLLLYEGADPNISSDSGDTPLMHATRGRSGHHNFIRDMLVYEGADVNAQNLLGDTPLTLAVEANHAEHIRLLIWKGANIHPVSVQPERRPLFMARERGYMQIAEMLETAHQRKSTLPARALESADGAVEELFHATRRNDLETVRALLESGVDIESRNEIDRTILHAAASRQFLELTTFLVLSGAEVNVVDHRGMTPIMATSGALGFGWDCIRHILALAGTDFSIENDAGYSHLTLGAKRGNAHPMQLAIWAGVDPSEPSRAGTAMHIASRDGRHSIVEFLQARGVTEPPFSSNDPVWRFMNAAKSGDINTMTKMIDAGISPDLMDGSGQTALMHAIHSRRMDSARFLVEAGADIDLKNPNNGATPLRFTISWNYWEIHRFREELLEAGADPNLPDHNGRTPLIHACRGSGIMGHPVAQLLMHGADLEHRDHEGKTALDYARECADKTTARYLEEVMWAR